MARELGSYVDDVVREQGEPCDLMQAFRLVQEAEARLMFDRQSAYGHNNISRFKTHGIVIRAHDKLSRLATLVFGGKDDYTETVEDSLGDLANYGTIGVLLQRGWWELEFLPEAKA